MIQPLPMLYRHVWRLLGALCALLLVSASTPEADATPKPSQLHLRSASIEYYLAGPTDPVVEVRIILENTAQRHTDTTSILWDPAFAQNFVFLNSEPPPWRVRLDENGWGSLDTSGIIPGQYGTFRLWFAAGTYAAQEPRVKVVVNGSMQVADVIAGASHLRWQAPSPAQRVFEQGPLAALAGAADFVPKSSAGAFHLALALGLVLTALTLGGGVVALRAALSP